MKSEMNDVLTDGILLMIANTHKLQAEQTVMIFSDKGYRLTIQMDKVQDGEFDD